MVCVTHLYTYLTMAPPMWRGHANARPPRRPQRHEAVCGGGLAGYSYNIDNSGVCSVGCDMVTLKLCAVLVLQTHESESVK